MILFIGSGRASSFVTRASRVCMAALYRSALPRSTVLMLLWCTVVIGLVLNIWIEFVLGWARFSITLAAADPLVLPGFSRVRTRLVGIARLRLLMVWWALQYPASVVSLTVGVRASTILSRLGCMVGVGGWRYGLWAIGAMGLVCWVAVALGVYDLSV